MITIIRRPLFKRNVILHFIPLILLILISKYVFAENPNPIELKNSIKYSNAYIDKYNNKVVSPLEIEKINDNKIEFIIETVVNEHVCDLSGTGYSTSKNKNDFVFIYHDCQLHLIISDDSNTISLSDTTDMCPQYFCGYQGRINGFVFKKNKGD